MRLWSYLWVLSLLALPKGFCETSHMRFDNWGMEDGLPLASVMDITQDPQGFTWVATRAGLARFDGKHFTHFNASNGKIVDNSIVTITMASDGWLWIGTQRGLTRLNTFSYESQHFLSSPDNTNSISHNFIRDIFQDHQGNIWLATAQGIDLFNNKTSKFQSLKVLKDDNDDYLSFMSLAGDSQNGLFALSADGRLFEINDNKITQSQYQGFTDAKIILVDKQRLWVAGFNTTLLRYSLTSPQVDKVALLPESKVYDIDTDHAGNIWLATLNQGVQLVSNQLEVIRVSEAQQQHTKSLHRDFYLAVHIDNNGLVWLGSAEYGLFRQNPVATKVHQYVNHNEDTQAAFSIVQAQNGNIWLGYGQRIDIIDSTSVGELLTSIPITGRAYVLRQLDQHTWLAGTNTGILRIKQQGDEYKVTTVYNSAGFVVNEIVVYQQSLYIGGLDGLYYINDFNQWDKTAEKLLTEDSETSLFNPDVAYSDGLIDAQGVLWFAGRYGYLISVDPKINKIKPKFVVKNSKGLDTDLYALGLTNEGNFMIGAYNGLYEYDVKSNNASRIVAVDEDSEVCGLVVLNNSIWLNSTKAVFELDNNSKELTKVLHQAHGVSKGACNPFAYLLTKEQCVYVGRNKGVSYFCPNQLPASNENINPVVFTAFDINYLENLPFQQYSQYTNKPLFTTKNVVFDAEVKQFGLDFTVVNFDGHNFAYEYKLDGFMDNWINTERKKIAFTTLPSGQYNLHVKAYDKLRPELFSISTLAIEKKPPFWQTTYAYIIYILFSCLLVFAIVQVKTHHNRTLTRRLKAEVSTKTAELVARNSEVVSQKHALELAAKKQAQLLQQKNTMLSAISHEMKTPLTVIKGAIQHIDNGASNKQKALVMDLMDNNCDRLTAFVNQILLVSKYKQTPTLQTQTIPLSAIVRAAVSYLQPLAEQYKQAVHLYVEQKIQTQGDAAAIELVINNLVKNAIVHTGMNCSIEVHLKLTENDAIITVIDNGCGMDEQTRQIMFEPFVSGSGDMGSVHSGLGLSLCKEIITNHQGQIEVLSELGKGSEISVILPNSELINKAQTYASTLPQFVLSSPEQPHHSTTKPLILIVDDEPDVLVLLSLQLGEDYRLITANGGEEALEILKTNTPDIIIMDMFMPNTSGLEAVRQIRFNETCKTSAIIMCSADTSDQNRIKGLKEGIDLFIEKPFDYQLLKAHIKRLLEKVAMADKDQRLKQHLQERSDVDEINEEENFLNRLSDLVHQHYQDPEFTIKIFASHFDMSEVTFRQRVQKLTGNLPKHYLFNYRCEKAKLRLDIEAGISLNDIAEGCGFTDESQMRRWFKEFYGVTPSKFRNHKE